ncbi:MAG TPA: tyrosine/phenylalanine carboxypeptidase domain-containing protein [Kofleriaceae bacterium]
MMEVGELLAVVRERLAAGKPVRRSLPGGGRLHIDRAVPFLCIYTGADRRTSDLVRTHASYLIGEDVAALAPGVVEILTAACGACLVVEVLSGASDEFRIHTSATDRLATTIEVLSTALREMKLPVELSVEVVSDHVKSLVKAGILSIGLEVPPISRYPIVAHALSRELTNALLRTFFEFARVQTPTDPQHFHTLGRRRTVRAVRESDRALAEISESFDFLLAVTPVNSEAAWREFCDSGRSRAPTLHYRLLELDPALGKRRLYNLPLDRLEDPVLAELLHAKRQELDRQLSLLEDRDTPRFLYGSLQLYGAVEDELFAEAASILARFAPSTQRAEPRCHAIEFAARARDEVELYRSKYPSLATTVTIRDDITSLLVSHGDVLIPATLDIAAHRVDALLNHELGTHVVTYANGRAQPLHVLAAGLAGYEALQEGLATFAEYLVGGLDTDRLRLIAARVIAVRRLLEEVSFPAVVAELVEEHRIPLRSAFTIALRVFRGGGLTKDAIYLRGLVQLLAYLRSGQPLEPLLVGKLALDQVALVEELLRRGILTPPVLTPRWLADPAARERLARVASLRVTELHQPGHLE